MRQIFILFFVLLSFISCDKENNEQPLKRTQPPVGESFSDNVVTLIFESTDSLRYSYKQTIGMDTIHPEGKAAYTFKDDTIRIINPYGRLLDREEVLEPYIALYTGVFIDYRTIDASYHIVGKGEREVISGKTYMYLKK